MMTEAQHQLVFSLNNIITAFNSTCDVRDSFHCGAREFGLKSSTKEVFKIGLFNFLVSLSTRFGDVLQDEADIINSLTGTNLSASTMSEYAFQNLKDYRNTIPIQLQYLVILDNEWFKRHGTTNSLAALGLIVFNEAGKLLYSFDNATWQEANYLNSSINECYTYITKHLQYPTEIDIHPLIK